MLGTMVIKKCGGSRETCVSSTGPGPDGRFLITVSISLVVLYLFKLFAFSLTVVDQIHLEIHSDFSNLVEYKF